MARFSHVYRGRAQVIVLPKGLKFTWPASVRREELHRRRSSTPSSRSCASSPSELCDDEHVPPPGLYVDVIGVLPTVRRNTRSSWRARSRAKREKLIDELLGRKEFVELWVLKWAELLQIRSSNQVSATKAMLLYYDWLQEKHRQERAGERVGAGVALGRRRGTFKSPATNYYQNETGHPEGGRERRPGVHGHADAVFAQCHNHPFDRWKMDDYYGFAAFFSQIGRKGADDPREQIVYNSRGGEVIQPPGHAQGDEAEVPRRGGRAGPGKGEDRRQGDRRNGWPRTDNPYFATRTSSNRGLAALLRRQGIIDEVDDVRISNPASNPGVVGRAGQEVHRVQVRLQETGPRHLHLSADVPALARRPTASRRRATRGTTPASYDAADQAPRRSWTCISQVTETKNKFPGLPNGAAGPCRSRTGSIERRTS